MRLDAEIIIFLAKDLGRKIDISRLKAAEYVSRGSVFAFLGSFSRRRPKGIEKVMSKAKVIEKEFEEEVSRNGESVPLLSVRQVV